MLSRKLAALAALGLAASPALAQTNPARGLSLTQSSAVSSARASARLKGENDLMAGNPLGWVLLAAAGVAFVYVAIQIIDDDNNDNPVSP